MKKNVTMFFAGICLTLIVVAILNRSAKPNSVSSGIESGSIPENRSSVMSGIENDDLYGVTDSLWISADGKNSPWFTVSQLTECEIDISYNATIVDEAKFVLEKEGGGETVLNLNWKHHKDNFFLGSGKYRINSNIERHKWTVEIEAVDKSKSLSVR